MRNRVDETRDEFIERCMVDPELMKKYPNVADRFVECKKWYTPLIHLMDGPLKEGD